MRKRWFCLFCFTILLCGCNYKENTTVKLISDKNETLISSTPESTNGTQRESFDEVNGIYYSKENENTFKNIYQPLTSYVCSFLDYNGSIYTISNRTGFEKSEYNLDVILGDKLGIVYGNHNVYWSTDEDKLYENTLEGTVYKVNGYEEDYKVCIVWESTNSLSNPEEEKKDEFMILNQLNDITLSKGSDLYQKRMHLDEAVAAYGISGADYAQDTGFSLDAWEKLSMEDTLMQEFLTAVFAGQFVAKENETYPNLDEVDGYPLVFIDEMGLPQQLRVFSEGYIMVRTSREDIIEQIDLEACLNLIDKIDRKE